MRGHQARFGGLAAAAALAVVGYTAEGVIVNGQALEPPEQSWVGRWNGASGVAIGERSVLTAGHAGGRIGGRFVLAEERYTAVALRRHAELDLMVITVDRNLPGYYRIAPSIAGGVAVVLGGAGFVAGEASASGVSWSTQRRVEWGTNVVESASHDRITLRFDAIPGEGTFARFDSGAGVFVRDASGGLLLAGIATNAGGRRGESEFGSIALAVNVTGRGLLPSVSAIPAPGSMCLMGACFAGFAGMRPKRRSGC